MDEAYLRILDVNTNRATEGLRVVEEVLRHVFRQEGQFVKIRSIRHQINHLAEAYPQRVSCRDAQTDPGRQTLVSERVDLHALLKANLKRVQEALRVLEEISPARQEYMALRFEVYVLESELLKPFSRIPSGSLGVYVIASEVSALQQAVFQGVRTVQLRDKQSTTGKLLEKAFQLQALVQRHPDLVLIINDRPDIAKLVGAGVHIGQDDMSVAQAREILGPLSIIGKSTHNFEQARVAQLEGADYIGVGPVWETPTKPGRTAAGLEFVRQVASEIKIPYVAIGGINLENVDQVLSAGARNIALVRAVDQIPALLEKVRLAHE